MHGVLGEPFRRRETFRVAIRLDHEVLALFRVEVSEACLPPLRSSARSSRASSVYASDPNLAVKAMQLEAVVVLFSSPFGTALDDGAWPGRGNHGTPSKRTSSL